MNITQLRQDTPGTQFHKHLNNAGASLPTTPVLEAVQSFLKEEALHGGYEMMENKSEEINGFYRSCAQLINTTAKNIAFTSSATEAYNKALSAIPLHPGDTILTTDDDYSSNQIAFLFLQKKHGIKYVRAEKQPEGGVDVNSVEQLIKKHQPKLVAVTHVPTNSGLIQDVVSVGKLCQESGIWYLVDACQSVGQLPIDVQEIGCDFLSGTMRKWLRGPRGAGFLYASDRVLSEGLEPVFPDLSGADWNEPDDYEKSNTANRFEYFEKNYAILLGSKVAIEYAQNIGLKAIAERVGELADYTRSRLEELPGWRVLDQGRQKCGIVTAHHPNSSPADFSGPIAAANINLGFARTQNAVIDFQEKGVTWAMRVSPHYYNTKEEIDELITVLQKVKI